MPLTRAGLQFVHEDGRTAEMTVVRAQEGHYMARGGPHTPGVGLGDSWQIAAEDALKQQEERERRRQAAHAAELASEIKRKLTARGRHR